MMPLRLLFAGLLLALVTNGEIAMAHAHPEHRIAPSNADQTVADHAVRHRHAGPGDTLQTAMAVACSTGLCHPEFLSASTSPAPRATVERHARDAGTVRSGLATDVLEPPPKGPL